MRLSRTGHVAFDGCLKQEIPLEAIEQGRDCALMCSFRPGGVVILLSTLWLAVSPAVSNRTFRGPAVRSRQPTPPGSGPGSQSTASDAGAGCPAGVSTGLLPEKPSSVGCLPSNHNAGPRDVVQPGGSSAQRKCRWARAASSEPGRAEIPFRFPSRIAHDDRGISVRIGGLCRRISGPASTAGSQRIRPQRRAARRKCARRRLPRSENL